MNRIRSITIASTMMLSLGTFARPAVVIPVGVVQDAETAKVPPVEPQLKLLTEKLSLTDEQQDKIKPILQELHDTSVKLVEEENMSRDERMNGIHTARLTADKKMRVVLNEGQKKKLDQVESEPHPELHGELK
jgi:Spy/CpxP family protein refolding chaperone